jgi:hypothetical protein
MSKGSGRQKARQSQQKAAQPQQRASQQRPPQPPQQRPPQARRVGRQRQQRSQSWIWFALGGAALVALVVFIAVRSGVGQPATPGEIQRFGALSRTHSEAAQSYAQSPPVGGAHSATWQNCGIYDQPVRNENAVHTLEHGAVWITYRPDLPAAEVEQLRTLARGQSYVLMSPYPGLQTPVAASAWGLQLTLESVSDPKLADFVRTYQQGSQTPEPGAPCTGGTGLPQL